MIAGALSLAACSLMDLSSLTNGSLSPDGDGTDGADDGSTGGDLDATFGDDGSVVPNDTGGGNDTGTTDASSADAETEPDAADGGANDAQTDAADEDATTGPTCGVTPFMSPSAAGNVYLKPSTSWGSNAAWSSLTKVLSENGQSTTGTALQSVSQILRVSGFGFTLSDTATIQGVEIEIVRAAQVSPPFGTDDVSDNFVQLRIDANKNSQGTRKLNGTWPSTMTTVSYGGSSDTWDETLTGDMVKNATFGVLFSFVSNQTPNEATANIDTIRMRLHYCQ